MTDSLAAQAAPASTLTPGVASHAEAGRIVGRNMLALVLSQFVTTPVSIVVNAMLARALGATSFGAIYLASTVLSVGFLLVDWGGRGQVAAEIARDRKSAPAIFGTGLLLRIGLAAAVLAALPACARLMGYDAPVRLALGILGLRFAIVSLGDLCNGVLRGFEKIDWQARATVAGNLIEAALVIATLLLGGGLKAALTAQVVAVSITLCVQVALMSRLHMGRPRIDSVSARLLVSGGLGFLFLDFVLKMQPYIDAAFLSRLAPPQALGWYSAAQRISGVLIFPSLTLNLALYPTLARLWKHDRATHEKMMRIGLRLVIVLGVLAGTGTAIFAPFIVSIVYGKEAWAPAAADLAVLAAYVLLVYTTIVLGAGIASARRQFRWALAQSFCLVVSVALDPLLIPWAQARYGNGSLGVCISVVVAETFMVTAGVLILPHGRKLNLGRTVRRALLAGAAMGAIGYLLRGLPAIAIPATVLAYGGALWLQGEIDSDLAMLVRMAFVNKLARRSGAAPAEPQAT
ncbi:MAG TPA: oligosaccharide flippase family protein [Myxococcales bacterium]|nr:oligosaccharide flippase family protein [Myxococcales bacterium]